MNGINRIWIVARWEFSRTVARIGFIATLLVLPLAHVALAALIGISVRTAVEDTSARLPLAIVDPERVLGQLGGEPVHVIRDADTALQLLRTGQVEAVYVLDRDYLSTGNVRAYSKPPKNLLHLGRHLEQRERASTLLRKGLTRDGEARSLRLVEPIENLDRYRVDQNAVTIEPPFAGLAILAGPFGVCFVLGLAIFLSSSLLQQAMLAELQNRMLEVLLTSITPTELLAGKLLGLSAAGLLQVSVYLATAAIAMPMLVGTGVIPVDTILWSGTVFLTGYVFFATVLAGTGALVRDTQEHTQIASVCFLIAAAPFFFLTYISGSSPSLIATALTWFPPTAPVTLLLRLGSDDVGTLERWLVLGLVVVSSAVVLMISATLFERRLLSGQPFDLWRRIALMRGRS